MIDASILAAWFLYEKSDPRVEMAFDTVARIVTRAPSHLYYEIRNALLVSERRNRMTVPSQSCAAAYTIGAGKRGREPYALARKRKLTVYDAAYLEPAKREGIALGDP